jgi:hypothetical protein
MDAYRGHPRHSGRGIARYHQGRLPDSADAWKRAAFCSRLAAFSNQRLPIMNKDHPAPERIIVPAIVMNHLKDLTQAA